MKKIIFIIICLIVAILVGIFLGFSPRNSKNEIAKESSTQMTKVRLNEVTRSVFYAPQYLAIANGYFADENIELDITTGQGTDKVTTALLSGQSDIGLMGPEGAIYVYNEGKENYIQVFAQLTNKDGSFLIGRENTDTFSWNDLKGKTVIPGRKGGVPYMTLRYVLKQNGIDPDQDLVLDDSIQFSLMAGAFTGGNADYVTLFEPTASMTQDQQKGYILTSIGKEAGEIPYTAYTASKSYIQEHPEIIEGITRAIYRGQKWVKEHSAKEVAEKIVEFFPDTTLTSLEKSVRSCQESDAWNHIPIMKEEGFKKLQEIMKDAGELEKEAPFDQVINNDYAKKVVESEKK